MSNRLLYDRGGGGYGRAWAQRWLDGHETWGSSRPRLDLSRYGVTHVTEPAARAFSTQHHYLTSWVASTRRRYGLFDITTTPARPCRGPRVPPTASRCSDIAPAIRPEE